MLNQDILTKKKEYETIIREFVPNARQNLAQSQQQELNQQKEKSNNKNPNQRFHTFSSQQLSKTNDDQRKMIKPTLSKSISHKNQSQPSREQLPSHQSLLQKIGQRIELMNEHISAQIQRQENLLLSQYEQKLRSKQEELNRLRLVTNPELIKRKTEERKSQLRREKSSLIQGNFYYNQKLEQLKIELNRLIEKRDSSKNNLAILMLDQQNRNNSILERSSQDSSKEGLASIKSKQLFSSAIGSNKFRKKLQYFSGENYAKKSLSKQNQKYSLIKKSLAQSGYKRSKLHLKILQRKDDSILPHILQKNQSITQQINPERKASDLLQMRKIKDEFNKFNRARSSKVFDNNENSVFYIQPQKITKQNNLSTFLRRKKTEKDCQNLKPVSFQNQKLNHKLDYFSVVIEKPQEEKAEFNKEYFEQFVLKKSVKQPKKKQTQQKNTLTVEALNEKQKIIQQYLEPRLVIQTLFYQAADDYYKLKKRQQKISTEDSQISDQMSRTQSDEKVVHQSKKSAEVERNKLFRRIEMSQFDKRLIMDHMLNSYNFKKFLYDLIVQEFEHPKISLHLDIAISKFDSELQKITKNA